MSENGAFVQSENGAFVESQNNQRGGGAPGPAGGEFYVLHHNRGTFESVGREWFEISRVNGQTGAVQNGWYVYFPPQDNAVDLNIWGFERIGNTLYVLFREIDFVAGNAVYLDAIPGARTIYLEGAPSSSTVVTPRSLLRGFSQDGAEELTIESLLAMQGAFNGSSPSLSLTTILGGLPDGLGATYAANPMPGSALGKQARMTCSPFDPVQDPGVKFWYGDQLPGTDGVVRAVRGTNFFNEYQGPITNRNMPKIGNGPWYKAHEFSEFDSGAIAGSTIRDSTDFTEIGTGSSGNDDCGVRDTGPGLNASYFSVSRFGFPPSGIQTVRTDVSPGSSVIAWQNNDVTYTLVPDSFQLVESVWVPTEIPAEPGE